MAYDLLCQCGRALEGERQARHQVLACPGCGRAVFVLPRGLPVSPEEKPEGKPARRWWGAPLLAGVALVAVLLGLFVVLLPRLSRPRDAGAGEADAKALVEEARRHLGQGKFHLARKRLDEAVEARDARPDSLTPRENRELNQLHRQADLFARLLLGPLEDVVRHARLVRDPDEWALQFAAYRGRAVLFDDAVRRDDLGRPALANHVVEVDGEAVRLALEDLDLLGDLPLDSAPRLIFGGRVASCSREAGGWVVRFERDSGVLLTDLDALAACLTRPADDEMKSVLARQQKWLDERAVVAPARP